jgi:hypothetical protein
MGGKSYKSGPSGARGTKSGTKGTKSGGSGWLRKVQAMSDEKIQQEVAAAEQRGKVQHKQKFIPMRRLNVKEDPESHAQWRYKRDTVCQTETSHVKGRKVDLGDAMSVSSREYVMNFYSKSIVHLPVVR